MRRIKKSGITALTAAIALSLGAIPVALTVGILPSGQTTTITPATDYFPGPTLTLSTAPEKATVSLSGTELSQQFDGGQFCKITNIEPSDDLLEFAGTIAGTTPRTGLAGFRDGSIGVFEGTNASQCFRIDAASFTEFETLTVGLGNDLAEFRAESGLFDLEMKTNDVRIRVEALDASNNVVRFKDGASTTTDKLLIYTGKEQRGIIASPTKLKPSVRSGGHFPLALTKALLDGTFTQVKFTAEVGSFTLEGGGDTGTSPTTLSLVQPADANLCSDPINDGGTNSLTEDNTTVTYIGNADGTDDCFGVQLTSGPTEVSFLKPRTTSPVDAQFIFVITWTLPNSGGTPSVTLPDAEIDFEFGAENFTNMPFCSAVDQTVLGYDGLNRAIVDYAGFLGDDKGFVDFDLESPEKEFACIEKRSSPVTEDTITIHDTIFVIGDLKMRL